MLDVPNGASDFIRFGSVNVEMLMHAGHPRKPSERGLNHENLLLSWQYRQTSFFCRFGGLKYTSGSHGPAKNNHLIFFNSDRRISRLRFTKCSSRTEFTDSVSECFGVRTAEKFKRRHSFSEQ
jgi:hypothetical protein